LTISLPISFVGKRFGQILAKPANAYSAPFFNNAIVSAITATAPIGIFPNTFGNPFKVSI